MTNMEIITGEMILRGIEEEVDTYQGWKNKGYQVQKGNKALFTTTIWKPTKAKVETEEGQEVSKARMIMVKASFFGKPQVAELATA